MAQHEFKRIRQEVVRRWLRVFAREQLTPNMLRITFESDELRGFHSPSADDHVKLFLPANDGGQPIMRDFTPRAWNTQSNRLAIDFALHPSGPAVDWARNAKIGDRLEIGGPRGSMVAPGDFDWYLLIGDATALPSIGRRLEELVAGARVATVALIDSPKEEAYLAHVQHPVTWLHSSGEPGRDLSQIVDTLSRFKFPTGDGFIWIAAETSIARGVYRHVIDELKQPKEWVKAGGYWSAGRPDASERIG